jgi:hypothetical protein
MNTLPVSASPSPSPLRFAHGGIAVPPARFYTVAERVCAPTTWVLPARSVPAGTAVKVPAAELAAGVARATAAGIAVFLKVGREFYRVAA